MSPSDVPHADWSLVKVTDFDARHVQIMIEDQIVLMRKEDCFLNATQILALTKKDSSENERLLQRMEQSIKVEVLPPIRGVAYSCAWVNFELGRILCKHFGLEQELQPLIDHGLHVQRHDHSKAVEHADHHHMRVWRRPIFVHGIFIVTGFLATSVFHNRRTSSTSHGAKVRFQNKGQRYLPSIQSATDDPNTQDQASSRGRCRCCEGPQLSRHIREFLGRGTVVSDV